MKKYFMSFLCLLIPVIANAMTPKEYIRENKLIELTKHQNKEISNQYGPYFSAEVYKELTYSKKESNDFREFLLNQMNSNQKQPFKLDNVVLLINMGLGWDTADLEERPFYVQNFVHEISSLGINTYFFERYPYNSIEINIETIKPQITSLIKNNPNKKFILLSLCKGSPELLRAFVDIIKINPEYENNFLGYINMSGMLGGTFFSKERPELIFFELLESIWDQLPINQDSFTKRDRRQTIWSLPFMRNSEVYRNIDPILDYQIKTIPVINITGAMTSDYIGKSDSPLSPFIKANKTLNIYPYANDGFIDITDTRLPKSVFPHQKNIVLESSHLLADGFFENYDLREKEIRLNFYHAIIAGLIQDIQLMHKKMN